MFWLIISIVLWGLFHSMLAWTGIKDWFRRAFGDGFMKVYRLLYNVFAVISILPVLYLMAVLPDQPLYQVPEPFDTIMRILQGISFILLLVAGLQTDLLSLIGLRQVLEEEKSGKLVVTGLYRFVRHPLYTFSLLVLWFSPGISLNTFVCYLGLTLYILVGIYFEERKLLREFGQDYAAYRAVTPMLIPGVSLIRNK